METTVSLALALLVRDDRALLVHRSPSRRHYPDCWDLVGGHVEPDESPEDAVVRECAEEIDVRIHRPEVIRFQVDDPALEVHAYLVTHWDGEPVNAALDEHDDLRWFSRDELAVTRLAHPRSISSIRAALHRAGGRATRG